MDNMENGPVRLGSLSRVAAMMVAIVLISIASISAVAAQGSSCPDEPFDANALDSDGEGQTNPAEGADRSDPCSSDSVTSSGAAAPIPPPTSLALTGPSTVVVGSFVGLLTLLLGAASLAIGRRVET